MKAVPLAVAGAFHTPIMRPADQRCAAAIAEVPMRRPRIQVIFNTDAQPHDDPEEIRRLMVKQIVEPVLWENSMRYLLGSRALTSFMKSAPVGCCAACCGASTARWSARAWMCDRRRLELIPYRNSWKSNSYDDRNPESRPAP